MNSFIHITPNTDFSPSKRILQFIQVAMHVKIGLLTDHRIPDSALSLQLGHAKDRIIPFTDLFTVYFPMGTTF